ncbi:MAG TPA: chemotaxis protein CheW [Steroidobacteraceae bacterium]|jgi:purine-binding chemotaxis protein CheW
MKSAADDPQSVLRARAKALAQMPQSTPAPESMLELVEFSLAQERYAIETRYVQEVHPLRELTALPGTPPFMLGIVNIRGRILPVFDLKKFFDLPEQGLTDLHRIIFVRDNEVELGLLADVVVGVRSLSVDRLQPSLPTLTGIRAHYLKGVTDERLVVLDLGHVLADPKILIQEEADA